MTNPTLANADANRVLELLRLGAVENPTDITEEIPGVNHRYARELLGTLTTAGLACVDYSGEVDVWRLTEAGSNLAQTNRDVLYLNKRGGDAPDTGHKEPEMTTKTAKTAKTTAPKAPKDTTPRFCGCGCEAQVVGKSLFRQGHDARMVSQLVAAVVGSGASKATAILPPAFSAKDAKMVVGTADIQARIDVATANINEAFGGKLADKAHNALMNGWQKYDKGDSAKTPRSGAKPKAAKAAKADAPASTKQVTAKVGRWTKTGHLTAEGDLVTTDSKGKEQIVAAGKYQLIEG